MQLFYNQAITEDTTQFSFSKEESRHIVKVLRKTADDTLQITNGKGWLFTARIKIADIKNCVVTIIAKELRIKRDYNLHLAVAPTKMNDRYEWFLEKATEIGIDSITPIICDQSERKFIKSERFEKILQSALKQSLNFYLPKLNDTITFKNFINQDFHGDLFIAHCENSFKNSLKQLIKPQREITILIGPEGDFSEEEREKILSFKRVQPIKINENILRSETAVISALSIVSYLIN